MGLAGNSGVGGQGRRSVDLSARHLKNAYGSSFAMTHSSTVQRHAAVRKQGANGRHGMAALDDISALRSSLDFARAVRGIAGS